MALRPYQAILRDRVRGAWAEGRRNVLARLATGGGKTVIISDLHEAHPGASAVIAHRSELVTQLSLGLARNGVRHNIIGAKESIKACIAEHMFWLGASFYNPGSRHAVCSVDTLVRAPDLKTWASQVTLWTTDEGHHLVNGNKWATGVELFTNPECRGLLATATPGRADGKGLGRHADGVADVMVEGPPERWLIDQGYLCDYDIVCPESDLALFEGAVGASGDWSPEALRKAAKASHIVGDAVTAYQRWAPGRLGVTFTTDTDTAADICKAFNAAGIRAGLLTGKTDHGIRRNMLKAFARRELMQLVVVDIVSEGFDLPAIEVASMDRPTASLPLYMQQFGRILRPVYPEGFDVNNSTREERLAVIAAGPKPKALMIDQVGNFRRHMGGPDKPREWSLNRRDRRSAGLSDAIPIRSCLNVMCAKPFERFYVACPHCGEPIPEPAARSSPKMVEGDLGLLDPAIRAAMHGEIAAVDLSGWEYAQVLAARDVPGEHIGHMTRQHQAKQTAQAALRTAMAAWGGGRHAAGRSDREIQREFWMRFGVDVLSAMALRTADAEALRLRVEAGL